MKTFANQMIPGDVFHPCETILEEMEAQNLKQVDLVNNSKFNKAHISLLLQGKRSISIQMAIDLEKSLNIKAEFWIHLQKNYELNKELKELAKQKLAS